MIIINSMKKQSLSAAFLIHIQNTALNRSSYISPQSAPRYSSAIDSIYNDCMVKIIKVFILFDLTFKCRKNFTVRSRNISRFTATNHRSDYNNIIINFNCTFTGNENSINPSKISDSDKSKSQLLPLTLICGSNVKQSTDDSSLCGNILILQAT